MDDVKLYVKEINNNYFVRVEGWEYTCIKDFCKMLGCYQKTFLKNMDQFNHYLYIYVNRPERLDFFFHTEKDAIAAKEWIESQLLMKDLLKKCLQNTNDMI